MKLVYRGIAYNSNLNLVPIVETATFATYRGLSYNCRRPLNVSTAPKVPLKYRGIAYNVESHSTLEPQAQLAKEPTLVWNS